LLRPDLAVSLERSNVVGCGIVLRFGVAIVVFIVARSLTAEAVNAEVGFVRCDPASVLGPEACMKCHENEVLSWKQTPHFETFETLHRKPEAKEIAERLGLRSVKRNDECTKCHFTTHEEDGRERAVAGVSCESCHGGARDWIVLHSDYGGPNVAKAQESAAHRQQRIEQSIAAGMNNPSNLYLIARQCLAWAGITRGATSSSLSPGRRGGCGTTS
jgi:hypothetical protein